MNTKTDGEHFGCVGSCIALRSGGYIDLLRPRAADIHLRDIAGALAKICRFGGQCSRFYSVAEHSINAARVAHTDGNNWHDVLATLLHDAAEAYIGDIVKPFKVQLGGVVDDIEDGIVLAISERFDVDITGTSHVWKPIDQALLIAERDELFSRPETGAQSWVGEDSVRRLRIFLAGYEPEFAEAHFIADFERASDKLRMSRERRAASMR